MVSSSPVYWQGQRIRSSCVVRDLAGATTNAPVVVLTITLEATAEVRLPTVTNSGTGGVYTADYTLDVPGSWVRDWVSSGNVVTAQESRCYVRPRVDLA